MPNRDLDLAMIRAFTRPIPLVLALAFCTFIPVMMATVRVVQIPLGALPEDSLRLASAPVALFLHSLAGVLFGTLVIKPQFGMLLPRGERTGRGWAM